MKTIEHKIYKKYFTLLGKEKTVEYRVFDEEKHNGLEEGDLIKLNCIENGESKIFKIRFVTFYLLNTLVTEINLDEDIRKLFNNDIEDEIVDNIDAQVIDDVFGDCDDDTPIICIGLGEEMK